MAVITLKDLMDPLSKIAIATEKTAQKLDAVIAAVAGNAGASLNKEIVKELKTQTGLLKLIAGKSSSTEETNSKKSGTLKDAGNTLVALGAGAKELAMGLIIFRFVPKGGVETFIDVIKQLFDVFDKNSPDKKKVEETAKSVNLIGSSIYNIGSLLSKSLINFTLGYLAARLFLVTINILLPAFDLIGSNDKVMKGAQTLDIIGGALNKFAKGLALAAIASAVGILFTPIIAGALLLIGGAFALLGLADKNIKKGADTLSTINKGLIWFSVGLVTFALASIFILMNPKILLAMAGSLILVGGAMALLGLVSTPIKRGAIALSAVGLSLAIFSIGYLPFALITKNIEAKDIGIQALLLFSLGAITALAGFAIKFIVLGALSFIAIGAGLAIFSIGYLPFALVTRDMTMETIGIQLALLTGLGLSFAAVGAGSMFIIPGAFAFAAIGGALWVLSKGLTAFKSIKFTEADASALTLTLAGIKTAFLGTDTSKETGVKGFFSKIGGAITGAVDSVRMLEATAGFSAAGLALQRLSKGLMAFKSVGWNDKMSKELVIMLNGVTTSFALAGGKEQVPSTSFFGQLFGFKRNAVEEGIMSVMKAGKALNNITKGLMSFQKLIDSGVKFGQPNSEGRYEEGTLGYAVTNTIGFINESFAAVAEQGNVKGGGFFDTLFKIDRNKVAEGISSVKGAGKALLDITEGLMGFQELINNQVKFGDPKLSESDYGGKDTLAYAVINTIGFINEAFAAVAEEGNVKAGGFFGSLFGIKKNKVAEGISSVKGAGKELTNIAAGLKSFQDLIDKDINWTVLGEAVEKSLGFIGTAFASIAEKKQTKKVGVGFLSISWDQNKVDKGIRSVKGAGKELTNIATGLKSFQEMVEKDVNFNDIGNAIKTSITLIGDAFSIIGGQEQTDSTLFGIIKWDENLVKKGIENVKGAGTELTNIANGLQSFATLKNPAAIANSIKKIFTSIGNTFTFYYEKPKFKSQLDHMKGFITEISNNAKAGHIHKAADGMNNIAKAVNSIDKDKAEAFANLFKGAGDLTNNQQAFRDLLEAVKDIRDELSKTTATTDAGTSPTSGIATPTGETSTLTPVLNNINAALGRLNGTMSSLPAQIASIEIRIPD